MRLAVHEVYDILHSLPRTGGLTGLVIVMVIRASSPRAVVWAGHVSRPRPDVAICTRRRATTRGRPLKIAVSSIIGTYTDAECVSSSLARLVLRSPRLTVSAVWVAATCTGRFHAWIARRPGCAPNHYDR